MVGVPRQGYDVIPRDLHVAAFVILAETAGKLGAVLEGDGFIFYDVWIIAIS